MWESVEMVLIFLDFEGLAGLKFVDDWLSFLV